MPFYVTMKQPRTSVIRHKSDCDIISSISKAHDIPPYGIDIIIRRRTLTSDDIKGMLQLNIMIKKSNETK